MKEDLWQLIIKNKIINQALILNKINSKNYDLLISYAEDVLSGDKTNREGISSKVYFNSLFGKGFIRDDNSDINNALNYGYNILLSTFNKEIVSNGYLTEIGIHHKNEFNPYNLTCDLMEPFRIVIDNFVYFNRNRKFDNDYKMDIVNIFNTAYKYNNKNYILKDIIKMYTKNIFDILETKKEYKGFKLYER